MVGSARNSRGYAIHQNQVKKCNAETLLSTWQPKSGLEPELGVRAPPISHPLASGMHLPWDLQPYIQYFIKPRRKVSRSRVRGLPAKCLPRLGIPPIYPPSLLASSWPAVMGIAGSYFGASILVFVPRLPITKLLMLWGVLLRAVEGL